MKFLAHSLSVFPLSECQLSIHRQANLHPMRALFLIPKSPPPKLEGNFSASFKEFVALCLRKNPAEVCSIRTRISNLN
jgi:hypothetical protein